MFYKAVMFKAVMFFVLIQPWVQPVDMSPAPDATVSAKQEIIALQACCPNPWPCPPEEAMCAQ